MLECNRVSALLNEYHDRQLDNATALQVERHLERCESCRGELLEIECVSSAFGAMDVLEITPAFTESLHMRLAQAANTGTKTNKTAKSAWLLRDWRIYAAAAACIALIFATGIAFSGRYAPPLSNLALDGTSRNTGASDDTTMEYHTAMQPPVADKNNASDAVDNADIGSQSDDKSIKTRERAIPSGELGKNGDMAAGQTGISSALPDTTAVPETSAGILPTPVPIQKSTSTPAPIPVPTAQATPAPHDTKARASEEALPDPEGGKTMIVPDSSTYADTGAGQIDESAPPEPPAPTSSVSASTPGGSGSGSAGGSALSVPKTDAVNIVIHNSEIAGQIEKVVNAYGVSAVYNGAQARKVDKNDYANMLAELQSIEGWELVQISSGTESDFVYVIIK